MRDCVGIIVLIDIGGKVFLEKFEKTALVTVFRGGGVYFFDIEVAPVLVVRAVQTFQPILLAALKTVFHGYLTGGFRIVAEQGKVTGGKPYNHYGRTADRRGRFPDFCHR